MTDDDTQTGPLAGRPTNEGTRLGPERHVGMVRQLSDSLWARLDAACTDIRQFEPREVLSHAGTPIHYSALLLDGIMVRYVASGPSGANDRLMVALQVPGDFVDLHAFPLGALDHDVQALTATRIAFFTHAAIQQIVEDSAADARALWRLTMIDAAMHRHWTFRSGRLRALAAVADFFCEMDLRMQSCGREQDGAFHTGLMQTDLADIAGLSPVHVSRVLKDLRDAGLARFNAGRVEVLDRAGLRRLARFDSGYLYLPEDVSLA